MKQNIRNYDKDGKAHGKQIWYYSNGNIRWISNYHHGIYHGYQDSFNPDNSIRYKEYFNMGKWIYNENHWRKEIQIKI